MRVWSLTIACALRLTSVNTLGAPPAQPPPPPPSQKEVSPAPDFQGLAPDAPSNLPNDPSLRDEEPDAPKQKGRIQEETQQTQAAQPGVRRLLPPEPISSYASPLQISRFHSHFFFTGLNGKQWSLFLYQWRGNKFFNVADLKEGYQLIPVGSSSQDSFLLFQMRQLRDDAPWSHINEKQNSGARQISTGLYQLREQKWKFISTNLVDWVQRADRLWTLSTDRMDQQLVDPFSDTKRFVAPLQRGQKSLEFFQGFSFSHENNAALSWIDFCKSQGNEALCLWFTVVPLNDAPAPLPSMIARLPVQDAKPSSRWNLESGHGIFILSLSEPGARLPTRKWWKKIKDKKWHPLDSNSHADPQSHTLIFPESENRLALYFLKTSDGVNTTLKKTRIDLRSGTKVISKPLTEEISLPYQSDLFTLDPKRILVISSDGLREIDLQKVF